MPKPALKFDVHPPERRRKTGDVIVPGCCCCCCCCLHSVGGLIGSAIVASKTPGDVIGKSIYWRSLGIVSIASIVIGHLLSATSGGTNEPVAVLFMIMFFFPAVQLGATVISYLWVSMSKSMDPLDQSDANKIIMRITGRMVLGTIAGILLMVVMGGIGSLF